MKATLLGQKHGQNACPFAFGFHQAIVLTNPGSDGFTVVPGSIIPDEQPGGFSLLCHLLAAPLQELSRDSTDRTAGHEAQRHLAADRITGGSLLPKDSIACQRFGIRIALLPSLFYQVQRVFLVLPAMQVGKGKTTPPHFIEKSNRPTRLCAAPGNQAISCRFFSWYWGSGLVIRCLALFQLIPSRLRILRIASPVSTLVVNPSWKRTRASRFWVHRLLGKPKSRGLRWMRAWNVSHPAPEKAVCSRWGRELSRLSTAIPTSLKRWMTVRTVWSWHPSCLAIVLAC